ncbi:MAG: biopolymer transporter ExbD [Opitutae bacterium]|nr:biopolymer transporter ExbD [Opitutae bacterium]
MITRPLDLAARLSKPPRDFDVFFWVNAGAIALLFVLFGSRFVLAPGLAMAVGGPAAGLELPQVSAGSQGTGAASVVVSYRRDNVLLFEGGMFTLEELRRQMAAYVRTHPGAVLLVRADRQVSMQAFLDLCDMARKEGFASVLIAAEPQAQSGETPGAR